MEIKAVSNAKIWWESKSFWAGIITIFLGIIGVFMGSDLIQEHPQVTAWLAVVSGIVTMILRAITEKALKFK